METCARGFSYMPENKTNVIDLQYIEGDELERTWKKTLRQRHKQREQLVWDEFIKEQDVVHTLCRDDPYQFLEQLPEEYLKEMMEVELQKLRTDQVQEIADEHLQPEDATTTEEVQEGQQMVTFADEDVLDEKETYFHIFEQEKDNDASDPEDEVLNDSIGSPCTVRENSLSPVSHGNINLETEKSTENAGNLTESSIHCVKVKELRTRINEEICAILSWLASQDLDKTQESDDIIRMSKRAGEFCTRFNRIHMYQLQRKLSDLNRNISRTLPFAKYTQFQSQMVRIVSLHQHMLQSYQVFRKSLPQTNCVGESADTLSHLLRATREVSRACGATPAPADFAPVLHLYEDIIMTNCDRLQEAVNEYSKKMATILKNTENNRSRSPRKRGNDRKRHFGTWSKSGAKSAREAEARLSMYSLDTMRLNLNPKSTSSKDNQSSGTSKVLGANSSTRAGKRAAVNDAPPKTPKKSPSRSRRPLMRDPHVGKPRPLRASRDTEIRTMVEAVGTCASSHISREGSAIATPRAPRTGSPRGRARTPRDQPRTNSPILQRKSQPSTPRSRIRAQSPKAKNQRISPKANKGLKIALGSIKSDPQGTTAESHVKIVPASKIKSAKKDTYVSDSVKCGDNNKICEHLKVMGNIKVDESAKNQSVNVVNSDKDNTGRAIKTAMDIHNVTTSRRQTPRMQNNPEIEIKNDAERNKGTRVGSNGCEVTALVKQLCNGESARGRNERVSGAKNAQLLCINADSPRQQTTPQLLKILEETIQKKAPKPLCQKQSMTKDAERYRLMFNINEKTAENLFAYRTKFVQHMLTSPMYANSAVGKPWEMIGSISEKIIDDLVLAVAKDMEIKDIVQELYHCETH